MNELADANFLGTKIKSQLLLKKSSYGWGGTVIRNKQQVFSTHACYSITFHMRPETVTQVRYDEH